MYIFLSLLCSHIQVFQDRLLKLKTHIFVNFVVLKIQ